MAFGHWKNSRAISTDLQAQIYGGTPHPQLSAQSTLRVQRLGAEVMAHACNLISGGREQEDGERESSLEAFWTSLAFIPKSGVLAFLFPFRISRF